MDTTDRGRTDSLPLETPPPADKAGPATGLAARVLGRAIYIPLFFLVLFTGGVMGLYFQPPTLQWFYQVTGLAPGGGSDAPIAVSPEVAAAVEEQGLELAAADIVALGRLLPAGDIVTIAPPFGANDAAIMSVEASPGDLVETGDVVAILDNRQTLEADLDAARASVGVREASLRQTRELTQSLRTEAEANLERARATAANADDELARAQALFDRGIVTRANLDRARTEKDQADREVERFAAVLQRYVSAEPDDQADVIVAIRNLESARAELERARRNLERAFVRAPTSGTILEINVHAGEKPGNDGVATLGDLNQMKAEVEVYQTQIGSVQVGQPVQVTALALAEPLSGIVTEVGLRVGRQTILEDDPVANTDARVVTIDVLLDERSSAIASRYTDLEVVARIDTSGPSG